MMTTLTNWTLTQELASDQLQHPKATPLKHHTFTTLTLPYRQLHCDRVIKRECLNQFLISMKREHNTKNYLWKAELQDNGNIHFHILFDKFLPWQDVRHVWNRAVNRLGYVDWFATEHNSLDPNSTDIHSLRKTRNVRAYIAKYVSKEVGGRQICGHAWGRSDSLSKLKPIVIHSDYDAWKWLQSKKATQEHQTFSNEHVGITKFKELPKLIDLPYHHYQVVLEILKQNLSYIT